MQTNQEIAQGEQDKAQLEHALMTQAKHSQAVEAELAAANKRTRQLEVRLHGHKHRLTIFRDLVGKSEVHDSLLHHIKSKLRVTCMLPSLSHDMSAWGAAGTMSCSTCRVD